MCFDHLRTFTLGLPLQVSPVRKNYGRKYIFSVRGDSNKEFLRFHPIVRDHYVAKFSLNFGGRRFFTFQVGKLSSRNHWSRMKCTKEPCSRSRALVSSFSPLWKEGLLFIRCSLLFAVLSAAMLIVWCSQLRARNFIEAKFMPYICSMLSEYLQREIDFGKVRSISPLSITLESCSIGPSQHEFSCGELPTMKIRVRPFASLRSGKFVIDAVLFQPNILVSQKEDFSWLGIPSHPEDDIKRHSSSEEGIDYRTKTRRLAREISSTRWYRERFEAAREAAFLGYIVPNESPNSETIDQMRNTTKISVESLNSDSFFCMDDRFHRKDHHSKDMGLEYVLKHSELEKYFGVDVQGKSFKFWPRMLSHPLKGKFKREALRQLMVEAGIGHKRNNLQRSAKAAIAYFRDLDDGNLSILSTQQDNSLQAQDDLENLSSQSNGEEVPINDEKNKRNGDNLKIIDHQKSDTLVELSNPEDQRPITGAFYQDSINRQFETSELLTEQMSLDKKNGDALLGNHDKKSICSDKDLDGFSLIHDPFLTDQNKLENIKRPIKNFWFINTTEKNSITKSPQLSCIIESRDVHIKDGCSNSLRTSNAQQDLLLVKLAECTENKLDNSRESNPVLLETLSDVNPSVSMWFYKLKLRWQFLNHLKESFARYSRNQTQKLKLYITCKAEIFASEFTEAVNSFRANGIEKSLPVTLDSIYFVDGTLLLLGFGDQEPREMNYVDGHVKFQNHYTRLHVQLSGNCRKWRSNDASKNGGLLAANVFVDIVDQKWHANLKVENLFAPLFERIFELPVLWSKGRATGELHICMSGGENFPNVHGQLDVQDLSFEILDAPSRFSEITANLCFRGQRIFVHNVGGRFGDVPLEASGDFGINPEDGEFHLMCQVL